MRRPSSAATSATTSSKCTSSIMVASARPGTASLLRTLGAGLVGASLAVAVTGTVIWVQQESGSYGTFNSGSTGSGLLIGGVVGMLAGGVVLYVSRDTSVSAGMTSRGPVVGGRFYEMNLANDSFKSRAPPCGSAPRSGSSHQKLIVNGFTVECHVTGGAGHAAPPERVYTGAAWPPTDPFIEARSSSGSGDCCECWRARGVA